MGGTEWQNTPSMDVTEWLNTPSVDVRGSSSVGGTECPGVGPETEVKEIWLFGSFGALLNR